MQFNRILDEGIFDHLEYFILCSRLFRMLQVSLHNIFTNAHNTKFLQVPFISFYSLFLDNYLAVHFYVVSRNLASESTHHFHELFGLVCSLLCVRSDIFTSHWSLFWVGRSDFLSLVGAKETTLLGIIRKLEPFSDSADRCLFPSDKSYGCPHSMYIRTVSSLAPVVYFADPV